MAERRDDPDFLRAFLDRGPYAAALVAEDGEILWASEDGVARIFGYAAEEIVGTNILEYIDPTWNPAALDTIAAAATAEGLRLPTHFRALRKDGTTTIVEAWANAQVRDPVLHGLVAYIRRWDERMLLDEALEALGRGDALADVAGLLLASMACETLEAEGAIAFEVDDHAYTVGSTSPGLPPALAPFDGGAPDTPWAAVRASGERVVMPVADLPAALRDAAIAAGYDVCWCWPVFDVRTDGVAGCVVAWRRTDELFADYSREEAMGRIARITGLGIERRDTMASLHRAATIDPLTGLANRSAFYSALEEALAADAPVAVLFLDLDGFKPVNDEWGHATGDEVLTALAGRLALRVRPDDLVARIGGDEFAVLCGPMEDLDALEHLVVRLAEAVIEPVHTPEVEVVVGVSIGGVLSEPGATTSDAIVAAADRAMYEVKASGKGGWRLVTHR